MNEIATSAISFTTSQILLQHITQYIFCSDRRRRSSLPYMQTASNAARNSIAKQPTTVADPAPAGVRRHHALKFR